MPGPDRDLCVLRRLLDQLLGAIQIHLRGFQLSFKRGNAILVGDRVDLKQYVTLFNGLPCCTGTSTTMPPTGATDWRADKILAADF